MSSMSPLTSMNISLPDGLRKYVEQQVSDRHFSSASEYIRQLIREDQHRLERDRIEALLLEGLDSGPSQPMTPDLKRERLAALAQRKTETGKRKDDVA